MSMKKPTTSVLVPTVSIITGVIVCLVFSGAFIQGFNPLTGIVEATRYGSFEYITNRGNDETSTISYNMEDMYNSTHLYDFGKSQYSGRKDGSLKPDIGIYGECLRWESGQIVVDDLDIVDTSFTIEAWIYPTSERPLALAGVEVVFPYILKAENGSMQFQYSGGGDVAAFYSNQTVGLNVWTHVALVYDAFSGVAKWYLNGLEQGFKNVSFYRDWNGLWSIGRMRPDYNGYEWEGMIDEFRVYKNRVLTQEDIHDDMILPIAHKLTLTGLVPNSDFVQLWNWNEESVPVPMLQETAEPNGQVQLNVYSFSGG
ncbi:MAG: LamG domain-containing protein, partial [Promethearchaeota archaeon]